MKLRHTVAALDIDAYSDLARHVGPRAWSRLMQMCPRGYIVSLWSVPDYRRRLGGRA